jgi:hypothetical protein
MKIVQYDNKENKIKVYIIILPLYRSDSNGFNKEKLVFRIFSVIIRIDVTKKKRPNANV